MNVYMLDYKGMEALHAVIDLQSFDAAAKELLVTQPAITQRIKGLENYYGEPLLIRTHPYRLTALGEVLVSHHRQVVSLEEQLDKQLVSKDSKPSVSVAVNRDSLEIWLLKLIEKYSVFDDILLRAF